MNSPFQSLESLNQGRHISLLGYCGAAMAGWAALETPFAIWVFVIPHGPNFAPEIGPAGTFAVFSLAYTIGYLALFIILAVPMRLLVVKAESTIAKRSLPLVSGAAFALASGAFAWLEFSARDAYFVAMLLAVAGSVCMTALQIAAK
jgi:hypothetical protein